MSFEEEKGYVPRDRKKPQVKGWTYSEMEVRVGMGGKPFFFFRALGRESVES